MSNLKKIALSLVAASVVLASGCNRTSILNDPSLANMQTPNTTALMSVPNQNRIDVVDTRTNRTITTLKTDDRPGSLAVSPDGRLVLVTNQNSGTISVFLRRDNETFQELNSIGSGTRPSGIAFNTQYTTNSEAYVTYEGSSDGKDGKIVVLDTRDKNAAPRISRVLSLPGASPKKIVVSADGNRLFVTDSANARLIVITKTGTTFNKSAEINLSTSSGNALGGTSNGVTIEGMLVDANNRVYIANSTTDSVLVVNGAQPNAAFQTIPLRDNQIVNQNQVGPKNMALYLSPTGTQKLYVTGYNASVISVIDTTQLRLLRNIPLYQNTQGRDSYNPVGVGVAVNQSGEQMVYVTNSSGASISIINPVTDTLVRNTTNAESFALQVPFGEMVTAGPVR